MKYRTSSQIEIFEHSRSKKSQLLTFFIETLLYSNMRNNESKIISMPVEKISIQWNYEKNEKRMSQN